jgi:hypothetical protein
VKKRYNVLCALAALLAAACPLDGGNLVGPAGGFVFYDKGSYSEGWRYLECAPENAGTGAWERARELCEEYSHGGYDDWILPGKDALEALLHGSHGLSSFNNGVYWSSDESESDASHAWGVQNGNSPEPDSGNSSKGKAKAPEVYSKSGEYWAWPVRKF